MLIYIYTTISVARVRFCN